MHDCKTTQRQIIEFLLNGDERSPAELPAEIGQCHDCRAEFETLKDTLRTTTRMIDSTMPSEDFWKSYHDKLREGLNQSVRLPVSRRHGQPSLMKRVLTTSVRVPVPVAAAVFLMFAAILFLGQRNNTAAQTTEPVIVEVPVKVPVLTEKVVTRIVYRDRYRPSNRKTDQTIRETHDSTLASSQSSEVGSPGLLGFKPLDEIKLTVIKGGPQQ